MWSLNFYAVLIGMMIAGGTLIMRIWAIYTLSPWKVGVLAVAYLLGCVPFIFLQATNTNIPIDDPEVDGIIQGTLGCSLKLSRLVPFALHVTVFALQTVLFLVAVYKPWRMKRRTPATSLIKSLIQSEVHFYSTMGLALLLLILGALRPELGIPMNNSGLLAAVSCSMCTRLNLTTRKWNERAECSVECLVEMNIRSPIVFRPRRSSNEDTTGDIESGQSQIEQI
ncbi:hypothetical protein FS749_008493 [Ceratobasidium sp. UAMH 11750]|nr:hypothetical protein FS749_008493 [Ceratobasidium sp. UAMH 11750]